MIDTHCHLNKEDYDDVKQIIKNMGNNYMIVSMASPNDLDEVIELVENYENIYATLGIHPEFADTYTKQDLNNIEKYLNHPKVVGIGEIGLDYHYTKENKENQKILFISQIKLANKYKKTIVIHTRDAISDTFHTLKEYKDKNIKCNFHCYSGSLEMAKEIIKLNGTFGIGGVLTFKNEKKLKEIVKEIDLKYLLLETDSPYLTPEPFRGHKNEPKNIMYVAKKIAEIKNIPYEEVIKATKNNALAQFDMNIPL